MDTQCYFQGSKLFFTISNNVHTAKLLVANGNVGKNNGQRFIGTKLRVTRFGFQSYFMALIDLFYLYDTLYKT